MPHATALSWRLRSGAISGPRAFFLQFITGKCSRAQRFRFRHRLQHGRPSLFRTPLVATTSCSPETAFWKAWICTPPHLTCNGLRVEVAAFGTSTQTAHDDSRILGDSQVGRAERKDTWGEIPFPRATPTRRRRAVHRMKLTTNPTLTRSRLTGKWPSAKVAQVGRAFPAAAFGLCPSGQARMARIRMTATIT